VTGVQTCALPILAAAQGAHTGAVVHVCPDCAGLSGCQPLDGAFHIQQSHCGRCDPAGICGCGWVYCTGGTRYLSACIRKSGHHGAFCGKPACASCKRGGIYLYDPSYKKDKTQSLQDRVVFRLGVLSENKDTGKIGRMNAVLYLEATE